MERRPTDSDVMPAAVSDTPPKKARLPPEGRLAFVNAVKPEIARDFVLSCLSDDVGALIALVHASPAIRDLVAAQLTRLTCSGRVMCFVGANLLELDVSRRAGAERDGLADAGIRAIAERCPHLRLLSAANRGRVRSLLQLLEQHGGAEAARRQGMDTLATVARHPQPWTRQLVSLRAVQTLCVLDILNTRRAVGELGAYDG